MEGNTQQQIYLLILYPAFLVLFLPVFLAVFPRPAFFFFSLIQNNLLGSGGK
jgi:hypothetical protein